jgi:hypothetical protein
MIPNGSHSDRALRKWVRCWRTLPAERLRAIGVAAEARQDYGLALKVCRELDRRRRWALAALQEGVGDA